MDFKINLLLGAAAVLLRATKNAGAVGSDLLSGGG
jgi:hypothetical protein